MMNYSSDQFIVITSVASHDNHVLNKFAEECLLRNMQFIVIGDISSPIDFNLIGCDFYSVERQQTLNYKLAKSLPLKHYARKNLGYLTAISKGAKIIIETDDDNLPLPGFWESRAKTTDAYLLSDKGWVNIYKYFTDFHVWPRGFALEHIQDRLPELEQAVPVECFIQQGLVDNNPDVDAIYRLTLPLPVVFDKASSIALGKGSFCPFNSQNTTWFNEAFPLLYLPSYCNFRITDILRSFVAQRIAWSCGWNILFHQSTAWQDRNKHDLLNDFAGEIPIYSNSSLICTILSKIEISDGHNNMHENMILCYCKLIELGIVGRQEIALIDAWMEDICSLTQIC